MRTGGERGCGSGGARVEVEGVVTAQGITPCQYGSHVLVDGSGEMRAALRSTDPVLLDAAIGREVRLSGHVAPGHPVNTGPPLIDVCDVAGA